MCTVSPRVRVRFVRVVLALGLATSACSGVQSALSPAGLEAERVATLFWWMTGGALLTWAAVLALALVCVRADPSRRTPSRDRLLIVGAGIVVPVAVLTALLIGGLAMLPAVTVRAPDARLQITVVGEQWWWRVRYDTPGAPPVALANEIRIPVGERVQFVLESDNVIHSFWIPSLAGKIDMIPGRRTFLSLLATEAGRYRGVCAEYCGTAHALMAFDVHVMDRPSFDEWLAQQAMPAQAPSDPLGKEGQALFGAVGCSGCHRVGGSDATGDIGPDLTHIASRDSLAAGVLPNHESSLVRWLTETDTVKPDVHMPAFGMLPQASLRALVAYLNSLQ